MRRLILVALLVLIASVMLAAKGPPSSICDKRLNPQCSWEEFRKPTPTPEPSRKPGLPTETPDQSRKP